MDMPTREKILNWIDVVLSKCDWLQKRNEKESKVDLLYELEGSQLKAVFALFVRCLLIARTVSGRVRQRSK